MKYFCDVNNGLHCVESGFEYLIPSGANEITDARYAELVAEQQSKTYTQELSALNVVYVADRLELCQAWLVAAVADGVAETERKADVEAELNELDAQHAADIAELKTKHGVS